MSSEFLRQVVAMIEQDVRSRPSAVEFEMAYQARVAIDRIRFAIRHTEQFGPQTDQMREASLQLLEALHRLELADRKFQERSRSVSEPRRAATTCSAEVGNRYRQQSSREPASDRVARKGKGSLESVC
jgi:hypothetical protein